MPYQFTNFGRGQYDDYLSFVRRFRDPSLTITAEDTRRKWRIFDNPYDGHMLFAHTDRELAATLTLSGRRLRTDGRSVFGYELGDGWTADNHRRQGLFHELGRQARELAFANPLAELIIGAPNPQAEPNWRKHQYRFTEDDGSTLIVLPSPFNLMRGQLRAKPGDEVESMHAFSEKRLRNSEVLRELTFVEYERETRDFHRMNDSANRYLHWRFASAPDSYRHFEVRGSANRFHCALRTIRLGRLPVLVVSEYFLNGVRDDSERKFSYVRQIAAHYFRGHAGVCLNSRISQDARSDFARYLRMAKHRYLAHRPQPICYLFRDAPSVAQEQIMNGLRARFQLSDCDVG